MTTKQLAIDADVHTELTELADAVGMSASALTAELVAGLARQCALLAARQLRADPLEWQCYLEETIDIENAALADLAERLRDE